VIVRPERREPRCENDRRGLRLTAPDVNDASAQDGAAGNLHLALRKGFVTLPVSILWQHVRCTILADREAAPSS